MSYNVLAHSHLLFSFLLLFYFCIFFSFYFVYLIVYVGDVLDIFKADLEQSLLVMVPVRLGSESLNPIYIPCVKVKWMYGRINGQIVGCMDGWMDQWENKWTDCWMYG